jgi:hypothetical protein
MRRRLFLILLFPLSSTAALAGEWFHRTRVRKYCHLPCYDYKDVSRRSINPVSEVSLPLLETTEILARGAPQIETRTARTFQLSASELRIDHCSISLVTLTILDDGSWIANFRAHQQPASVEEQFRPEFERYLRNRFYVTFRGVGLLQVTQSGETAVVAPPEFFAIEVKPFWVEKDETQIIRLRSDAPNTEIRDFFKKVDRVDVDFRYGFE